MVLGRSVTWGHGWSDTGWRVGSVQQGASDYSPEAGEEARVQAEQGWGQGQALSLGRGTRVQRLAVAWALGAAVGP